MVTKFLTFALNSSRQPRQALAAPWFGLTYGSSIEAILLIWKLRRVWDIQCVSPSVTNFVNRRRHRAIKSMLNYAPNALLDNVHMKETKKVHALKPKPRVFFETFGLKLKTGIIQLQFSKASEDHCICWFNRQKTSKDHWILLVSM